MHGFCDLSQGAGSALLGRTTRLEGIVKGMSAMLDCPLTVKMRTGIHKKNWNAHKLIPKLRDCHISMATVSTCRHLCTIYFIGVSMVPVGLHHVE